MAQESQGNDKPKRRRTQGNRPTANTASNQLQAQRNTAQTEKPEKVKKRKWQAANTIAIIAVVVNACMLLATYLLFNETHKSTLLSQETLDSTKAYTKRGDITRRLERKEAKIGEAKKDSLDSISFENQKRSVDGQVMAFKQTQKNFEINNRAYLQAVLFDTASLVKGIPKIVFFNQRRTATSKGIERIL